jgi:hypothetical protein
MALLATVIAVGSPQLSRFFRARSLDSEARRMLSLVRYGQKRAASEGFPMLLWVDVETGRYGLEGEAGYEDEDTKSVEFNLEKGLELEVVEVAETPWSGLDPLQAVSRAKTRELQVESLNTTRKSAHADLPRLRLLADGSIDETSPESLRLKERDGRTLDLRLSRNRLGYEIADEHGTTKSAPRTD